MITSSSAPKPAPTPTAKSPVFPVTQPRQVSDWKIGNIVWAGQPKWPAVVCSRIWVPFEEDPYDTEVCVYYFGWDEYGNAPVFGVTLLTLAEANLAQDPSKNAERFRLAIQMAKKLVRDEGAERQVNQIRARSVGDLQYRRGRHRDRT